MGGALALLSAYTYSKPLAGIIALSCWLPADRPDLKSVSQEQVVLRLHLLVLLSAMCLGGACIGYLGWASLDIAVIKL